MRRDFAGAVACLRKAVDAAPKGPNSRWLNTMIGRLKPIAEAQETIATLKAALPKAKGIQRAKLLDGLIEAYGKTAVAGQAASPKDIEKWSQEIVLADPDNKAGLKHKYEFRIHLVEARKLAAENKMAEARAAVEKALAAPGLTGDQTQEARLVLGTLYAREEAYEKAVDCLKKALAAAPESDKATMIQVFIQRAERELKRQKADDKADKADKEKAKPAAGADKRP
jgi:tetratricopeptide (TPR) repeat protein